MKLNYCIKHTRIDEESYRKIQKLSKDLQLKQSTIVRMLLQVALKKIPSNQNGVFEVGLILNRTERRQK